VTLGDIRDVRSVESDAYRVEDIMSDSLVTISPDENAMDALQAIQEHDVGRLPVVDTTGQIVGIVSRTDLITAFNILQTGSMPRMLPGTGVGADGSLDDRHM
jgi:predicted transcriptional regulator